MELAVEAQPVYRALVKTIELAGFFHPVGHALVKTDYFAVKTQRLQKQLPCFIHVPSSIPAETQKPIHFLASNAVDVNSYLQIKAQGHPV